MSDITPSSIKIDAALEEKLKGASFEEIKAHLANASVSQGLCTRDIFDNSVLLPVETGTAPQKFAKVVIVNGVKHIIEGDSEHALLAAETAFYRQQFQPETEQPRPRNEHGQFRTQEDADRANQDEILRQSDLELRWKRGEVTSDVYLAESGALGRALEAQGIDTEALRQASVEKQGERFQAGWADATTQFLKSSEGSDWIGGDENMKMIGRLIEENGLVDKPSADTLAAVWEHMKQNGLAVENPDTAYQRELQSARSAEEITSVNHKYFGRGLFNR